MRPAVFGIGIVLLLACKDKDRAAGPPPPPKIGTAAEISEAQYADLLLAAMKKRGGSAKLHYDAEHSMITDGEAQVAVRNVYAEYQKLPPEDRPGALAQVASTFTDMSSAKEQTLDQVRAQLLPAVRAGFYFDWQLQAKVVQETAQQQHAVFVPLGELTGAGVAIDAPTSMQIATDKQLSAWGLTVEQALAIGVKNLGEKGAPFQSVQPGLWTSPAHDNYDSSRLLLLDEIKKLGLKGQIVAMIPNRDTLYLTSAQDAKALLAMADLVEKAAEEPRPIHTSPLCLTGTTWTDCEPAPTPEVKQRMHTLSTLGRQSLYGEQKDALQAKVGDDVFVASYAVLQDKKTSKLVSYATWSRTVPTLLPRADRIGFVEMSDGDPDAKPEVLGMVPWDKAMQILGTHLKRDGRNPPRWATGDYWPTPAELARLAPDKDPFK